MFFPNQFYSPNGLFFGKSVSGYKDSLSFFYISTNYSFLHVTNISLTAQNPEKKYPTEAGYLVMCKEQFSVYGNLSDLKMLFCLTL